MTTSPAFIVVEEDIEDAHRYSILEPNDSEWLSTVAEAYTALRVSTGFPLEDLSLNGVSIVDTTTLAARLQDTQLPTRSSGNFAVERSDLGEIALALAGEQLRGYAYGYRSTRDRELVRLPGRGIDQIGVRADERAGREVVVISLGEAKLSSDIRTPPGVVDSAKDSLREQHVGHLREGEETCAKLYAASRRCTDQNTQNLLQLAARLWETRQFDYLVVKCTSMLVRPSHGAASDYGTFASARADFAPGEIDFMVLRIDTTDIEDTVTDFLIRARGEQPPGDGAEAA